MAWRVRTKQQWEGAHVYLSQPKVSPRGGCPRVASPRCFEGILCILWTGAQWSELPRRYGSPSTCWRRLKHPEQSGVLLKLWQAFLALLNDQQKRRWDECFADSSFIPANKGGKVGPTKRAKGTKWMVLIDGTGTPTENVLGCGDPGGLSGAATERS
jgi:transposase